MLQPLLRPCLLLLALVLPATAAEPPATPLVALTPAEIAALPPAVRALVAAAAAATDDPLHALQLLRQASSAADPQSPARQLLDHASDLLEERLAREDEAQAAAQAHDRHWAYSESFLLQALALRARAAGPLRALWADPQARAAIGEATIHLHQTALDQGTDPVACRWRLAAALDRTAPESATPALLETLRRLTQQVGGADADVLRWTTQLRDASVAVGSPHLSAPLQALTDTLAQDRGDEDALVASLRRRLGPLARAERMADRGPWVGAIAANVGIGVYRLGGRSTASATSGGTSLASASTSAGGHATGGTLAVDWQEERRPDLGLATPLLGAGLRLTELGGTVPVPIAGGGLQTGTLTGATYQGGLTLHGIGAEVLGGARLRLLGPGGALTLLVLGTLGADAVTTHLGTRPQAVNGSTAATTASGSGLGWHAGLGAALAWRPQLQWEYRVSVAGEWLDAPGASSTGDATFLNASGTSTSAGTETTHIGRIRALGMVAALGGAYCW